MNTAIREELTRAMKIATRVLGQATIEWNIAQIQAERSGLREDQLLTRRLYNEMCDAQCRMNELARKIAELEFVA